jgi:hypothetical protein
MVSNLFSKIAYKKKYEIKESTLKLTGKGIEDIFDI